SAGDANTTRQTEINAPFISMSRRLICFIANRRLDQGDSVPRISNRRRYVVARGHYSTSST
ncbi:MAG TPA: hypothetical protein VHX43_16035, partial [Xanthobacteraceae bacterium]|nr:hypothetical protein [Xanthobacteraceae bacterium]